MNKTQVIQGIALVADHQTPEIAQPGEESLNFPPAPIAPKRATILGLGTGAIASVGRNHFNAQLVQGRVQWISVIAFVSDQPLWELAEEARVEGGGDQGNFARRSRGGTSGERKTSTVCHCHELRTLAPLGWTHTSAPFFATINVPSMKHSERPSPPRSLRSVASASRIRSKTPSRTQR